MTTVGIIQARMGSSRLPGKVMLPLDSEHVLARDIQRIAQAKTVDEVVVATSDQKQDDIVARYAERAGADVFRGSEQNVLSRVYEAARRAEADIVVRLTGDCPLIDPETIDTVVTTLTETGAEYAGNTVERSFPRGLDVEAFTFESFERVHEAVEKPHHREHVTPYYHEHPDRFDLVHVTSDAVFDDPKYRNRTDLRLTLDEADDYELLREVYENVASEDIIDVRDAIDCIDAHNLQRLNESIEQKEVADASGDSS